jgi:hypothetical protein
LLLSRKKKGRGMAVGVFSLVEEEFYTFAVKKLAGL